MRLSITKLIFSSFLVLIIGLLTSKTSMAQSNLQVKDANGNVLLEANEKGVQVKKVTTPQRLATTGLNSSNNGLIVFDTDSKGLFMWLDSIWKAIDAVDLINYSDTSAINETNIAFYLVDSTLYISDSAGTLSVDIGPLLNNKDDDFNPQNEVNLAFYLADSTLYLTDSAGTLSVDIGPLLIHDHYDGDSSSTNETNKAFTLVDSTLNITDNEGTLSVDIGHLLNNNDGDTSSTNELNMSFTLVDSTLNITDGGGTLSVNMSTLLEETTWIEEANVVYNNTADVGIGTDAPEYKFHVQDDQGAGNHVMLIENTNSAGNGLMIRIDGSHPLYVTGTGGNPDYFITHPGAAALQLFDTLANDIRGYLMNQSLDLANFSLSDVGTPNGIFSQLGMDVLMTGGICKASQTFVEMVNTYAPNEIVLPDLPLDNLPMDLYDIPQFPTIPNVPNFTVNPPNYQLCGVLGNCYDINIPGFTVSSSFVNNPINFYNSNLNTINVGVNSVNNTLEDGYDGLISGLTVIDSLVIPIPQLPVPQNIGPITCPDPNPWDNFSFSFTSLDPLQYNIVDPLNSDNAFITFADQYDNKLGAITAQGLGEFTLDYLSVEKVLEIGAHISGLISDDGNIVENAIELGKEAIAYYKAVDKIGVLYSSGHGDYAEWLERADHQEEIGYGDIVGVIGGKISLSLEGAEQVMVVSKSPIVLGNIPDPSLKQTGNNIAFIGQVPVKVMGPVYTGDFIVASTDMPGYGYAVPADEITAEELAMAVGKSWETNLAEGFKYVNTIVGMHDNGWAVPVRKMQNRVNQLESKVNSQENTLNNLSDRLEKLESQAAPKSAGYVTIR